MKNLILIIISLSFFASSYSQYKTLGIDTIKPNRKQFITIKRKVKADSISTSTFSVNNIPDTVITQNANGVLTKTPTSTVGTYGTFQAYASGSTYNLTATPALINFGTTKPTITLTQAGTYAIYVYGVLIATGYSKTVSVTATIKTRRTNNTATDIGNSIQTITVPIASLMTDHIATITLPLVFYTTALTTDVIEVWGSVSIIPDAGVLTINQCSIIAVRQY